MQLILGALAAIVSCVIALLITRSIIRQLGGEPTAAAAAASSIAKGDLTRPMDVANAVTQMDTVTQENAALVEEAASAAKSIETQAHSLSPQIAYFRTGDRQAERVHPRAAAVTARVAAPQVSEESVLPLALAS